MLMLSSMTMGLSGAETEMHPESVAAPPSNIAAAAHLRPFDRPAPCLIRIRGVLAARARLVNLGTVIARSRFLKAEWGAARRDG
jgi:hypothetical protein